MPRTTTSAATKGELRLRDRQIERAAVLKTILDLIYAIDIATPLKERRLLCDTVGFVNKYDCQAVKRTLKLILRNSFHCENGQNMMTAFLLATLMDDVDLSSLAIRQANEWQWAPPGFFRREDTR